MGRHLHIDPFAGIAGDMFLGACIDLGVGLEAIDAALRPLPIERPYRITVGETHRHGIRGVDLKVVLGAPPTGPTASTTAASDGGSHDHDHHHAHDHAHEHDHHQAHDHGHDHDHAHDHDHDHAHGGAGHTGYRQIMAMIDMLDIAERAKQRARAIVTRLGEAEAAVHGMSLDAVHFHEVGAVDSIVDMLGSAVALELLDVDTVSSGMLPIGHGFVNCDHGCMPLPAPATAEILKGVPHKGVDREGETVTPTGAAIVGALATDFGAMPAMEVEAVGYGAGDRDPADVPNLLRLFLGQRVT